MYMPQKHNESGFLFAIMYFIGCVQIRIMYVNTIMKRKKRCNLRHPHNKSLHHFCCTGSCDKG